MAKIISNGHLPEDHPLFTGRWVLSSHKANKIEAAEKTDEPKSIHREPAQREKPVSKPVSKTDSEN